MSLIINGIKVAGRGKDGIGIVPGGTKGQVLTKRNNVDYDTEWTDLPLIDTTLSVSGQSADAKVVGDIIGDCQTSINVNAESIESLNNTISTKANQSDLDALNDELSTLYESITNEELDSLFE